ncbi:MAG: transcriptional repressor, partial [Alphaproteobacteria bacterium]|nr:transcriptional repressor [Alphaproteobacteria bacterium]
MTHQPSTTSFDRSIKLRDQSPESATKVSDLKARLRGAGLRPTVQRLALSRLLYGNGDRHVSAEALHAEAREAGLTMSLSTVYNTLNQFAEAGLLREIAVQGHR